MKRTAAFIRDSTPCDTNLFADGPKTIAEAIILGRQLCPNFPKCERRGYLGPNEHDCIMIQGVRVARLVLQSGNSLEQEMETFSKELNRITRLGAIWSSDRITFQAELVTAEYHRKVREFAQELLS